MKIYIESIILLNFLLDYMILYGTKRLLKMNKSNKRILLGSILGSTTIFLLNIKSSLILFLLKIIFSILMNLISFGYKNLVKNTFYFYMISIIVGGSITLIRRNTNFYENAMLLLIVVPIIIMIYRKEIQKEKLKLQNKYTVEIDINQKKYLLEGFIDTGNHLKDPITNKKIIIVNLKINCHKKLLIPYKALNYEGLLPCISPDKILINQKEIKNCLIGISKEKLSIKEYDCILPNELREELC